MVVSLRGQTIVVTGASSGIGAAAARALAAADATVVPIGRSPSKTAALAAELGVEPLTVDFADFASVRMLAAQLQKRCDRIDLFAHNAGAMIAEREITTDGHERTIQTNFLGPFLLQRLLHEQLAASTARILVTSSVAHHLGAVRVADLDGHGRPYSMIRAYAASKLADLLFARQLSRNGMVTVAFDPGFVATDFILPATGIGAVDADNLHGMHRVRRTLLNVVEADVAARGIVRFATMDDPHRVNGRLLSRTRVLPSSPRSQSVRLARELWTTSEELVSMN